MACCKCCCGNKDCEEGDQGKCCCGGSCCDTDEYCCGGGCQSDPCCDTDEDCDLCGCQNGWYAVPPGGTPLGCCPEGSAWDANSQTCGGSSPAPLLAFCCDGACSCEECPP